METTVKLATIIVKDMETSIQFYQEVMNLEIDSEYNPIPGTWIVLMKGHGTGMVELIQSPSYPVGFYSVGMYVDDMAQAMAHYKAKGAKILGEPLPTLVGSCAFIEDPNGVRLAIVYKGGK